MTSSRRSLPASVREILTNAVDSYEELEIVLQLHRVAVPLGTAALSAATAVPEDVATEALRTLARRRVVRERGGAWVLDQTGPWHDHVAALAQVAEVDRTEIFRFMTARAMERVRSEAARVFADAFVIRSKKKGGSDG